GKLGRQAAVCVFTWRDVSYNAGVDASVVLVVLTEGKFDLYMLAAFVEPGYFDDGCLLPLLPHLLDVFFVFRNDSIQRLAYHLGSGVTKNPLRRATNRQYSALLIERDNRVSSGFLDDLVAVF